MKICHKVKIATYGQDFYRVEKDHSVARIDHRAVVEMPIAVPVYNHDLADVVGIARNIRKEVGALYADVYIEDTYEEGEIDTYTRPLFDVATAEGLTLISGRICGIELRRDLVPAHLRPAAPVAGCRSLPRIPDVFGSHVWVIEAGERDEPTVRMMISRAGHPGMVATLTFDTTRKLIDQFQWMLDNHKYATQPDL